MRLIIVDDDRLVVDSLKIILGAQPQIEVVGTGAMEIMYIHQMLFKQFCFFCCMELREKHITLQMKTTI